MMHDVLTRLDAASFLGFRLWDFSFRSLRRRYALTFLYRIVLRHPWRTWIGVLRLRRFRRRHESLHDMTLLFEGSEEELAQSLCEAKTGLLVAVGFCQKPLAPMCPAQRPNHDCVYLDSVNLSVGSQVAHAACQRCDVRMLGTLALRAGACMHVMTSALDIARDVMIPSADHGRFSKVMLCLCPYSVRVIDLPLTICGLEGYLFGYASGNCANYEQWLQADRGFKKEMTTLHPAVHSRMVSLLESIVEARAREGLCYVRFQRQGNIYEPVLS
jgi:hypothetical protein